MDNFKDNETDIQHLIISSLEGTASEEELLVLQKWLEESEQHFLLFHAYRQDWIQAGCVQRYQTGEAWKKVERRLGVCCGRKYRARREKSHSGVGLR